MSEKIQEILKQEPKERYLDSLKSEAMEMNKKLNEIKKEYPDKPYEEILNEMIDKELSLNVKTDQNTNWRILPFSRLIQQEQQEATSVNNVTEIAGKLSQYYKGQFDDLFNIAGKDHREIDLSKFPAQIKQMARHMINTNLEKLELSFLDLVKKHETQLIKAGIVSKDFSFSEIYQQSPERLLLIINQIILEHMKYDFDIISSKGISDVSDVVSYNKIIESQEGVCRHFASLTPIIFEQFKRKSANKTQSFDNHFLLYLKDEQLEHAYNIVLNISAQGNLSSSIIDPTWISQIKINEPLDSRLDYSRERKFHAIRFLHKQILPPWIKIEGDIGEQPENDKLLASFKKFDDYSQNPLKISSYDEFEDFITTMLVTPTNIMDIGRFSIVFGRSIELLNKRINEIPSIDKKGIENLLELLLEEYSKKTDLFKKPEIEREFDLAISYLALRKSNIKYDDLNFNLLKDVYNNSLLQKLLLTQSELSLKYIEKYTDFFSNMSPEEKLFKISEGIKNAIGNPFGIFEKVFLNISQLKKSIIPQQSDHFFNHMKEMTFISHSAKTFDDYRFILELPKTSVDLKSRGKVKLWDYVFDKLKESIDNIILSCGENVKKIFEITNNKEVADLLAKLYKEKNCDYGTKAYSVYSFLREIQNEIKIAEGELKEIEQYKLDAFDKQWTKFLLPIVKQFLDINRIISDAEKHHESSDAELKKREIVKELEQSIKNAYNEIRMLVWEDERFRKEDVADYRHNKLPAIALQYMSIFLFKKRENEYLFTYDQFVNNQKTAIEKTEEIFGKEEYEKLVYYIIGITEEKLKWHDELTVKGGTIEKIIQEVLL